MEIKNFKKLISLIQERPEFVSELPSIEQNYLVKIYKITELNPTTVVDLYNTMQKKFYLNRKTSNEESWYENELRIFIWLLFAYMFVFHKAIEQLNEDDWKFFSPIFNYKSTVFFQFQSLSLLRPQARPASWSEQQTSLLQSIISQKNYKNRWNSIARELFIRSGKRFFRNPKQCRERWMNHLDPSKIHSEWTASQDLTLLNCIKKKGKRWSVAMKELSNTRTEHMVKNRYKSLISNESKRYPGKKQSQLENILIKKMTKILQKQSKELPKEPSHSEEILQQEGIKQSAEKVEKQEEKIQLSPPLEAKFFFKEEDLKVEDEHNGFLFSQNLASNFNDFQVNSPMFIPWHEDERKLRFDMSQDRQKNQDPFCGKISQFNSEELQF